MRPLRVLPVQRERARPDGARDRRPDVVVPGLVGAFSLGVVVAAVTLLAVQSTRGDTVPAGVHQQIGRELAAAQAVAAARQAALDDSDVLARRLIAALDSPTTSPAQRARLREQVAAQTRVIERVRVVRVPVPGPVVTVTPAPARTQQRPQPARAGRPTPAPAPAPTPPLCVVAVLGTCLAR